MALLGLSKKNLNLVKGKDRLRNPDDYNPLTGQSNNSEGSSSSGFRRAPQSSRGG